MLADFPGITGIFPHLMAIFFLWLLALFIVRAIKQNALSNTSISTTNETVIKASRIGYGAITSIAAIFAVVVILFLTSPFERNYDEMSRIAPAEVDESFTAPSKEEVDLSNEVSVKRKAEEKHSEAKRDNRQAMEDAANLFGNAAKKADSERNQ